MNIKDRPLNERDVLIAERTSGKSFNGRRCIECGAPLVGRERKYDRECAELVVELKRIGA